MNTMPATTAMCADCREQGATLVIRNRHLCVSCFIRYVNSKVLKRMESYRFKNLAGDQKRRLFLPLSGGVSSLVLLQVLDAQLQRQIGNRNRTAYDLVIARVLLPDEDCESARTQYKKLSSRFSLHCFLPLVGLHDIFAAEDKFEQDLNHLGLCRHDDESDDSFLRRMFASATSITTKANLQTIILRRVLVSKAKVENCESMLWGHSDSRLAALSLADVAKGRGGSVPAMIADGPSLQGINFNYPARDLFKVELETYADVLPEPISHISNQSALQQPASIRNTSIDALLTTYITSQGEKYPSIMANVVRTASKLQVHSDGQRARLCAFCRGTMTNTGAGTGTAEELCHGCLRMKQEIKS
jgi:cytoplasmic tRNA 2-thiolation protein 2